MSNFRKNEPPTRKNNKDHSNTADQKRNNLIGNKNRSEGDLRHLSRAIIKKTPCRKFGSRRQDNFDQVVEILKSIPGINKDLFHKPKISNKIKIDRLCCSMSIKDSTVPIFFHILKRFLEGRPSLNEFEKRVFQSLKKIEENGLKALAASLTSYENLPIDKRECIFKKEFLDWPVEQPMGPEIILKEWITEGLFLATQKIEPKGGSLGPGKIRKWEQTSINPSGGGNTELGAKLYAPWPWICAVSPGPDAKKWFRNTDYEVPGSPPTLLPLATHEKDVTCTPTDPNAPPDFSHMFEDNTIDITEVCTPKMPSSSGDNLFAICDGGDKYTNPGGCLKIPDAFSGQDVVLKGFNFFTNNCKVKLTKQDNPSLTYPLIDTGVYGDLDENKKTMADCRVEDTIRFTIPTLAPNNTNTFDAGLYELKVIVPNDVNESVLNIDTGQQEFVPDTFESNTVLLNIGPDPDLVYNVWNDEGRCFIETSGAGADEIWWMAGVASFKFDTGTGHFTHTLNVTRAPEDQWSDMDNGEQPDPYNWPLFNGKVGMPGSVAIALIGYEIDDEGAAKEQLKGWSDAFSYAIGEIWKELLALGGEILLEVIKTIVGGGWMGLFATIVVAVIVFLITAIWAAWAPPDLIAQDIMTFSSRDLFDCTKTNTPVPPNTSYVSMVDGQQKITVDGASWKDPSIAESTVYTNDKGYLNYEYRFTNLTSPPMEEIESIYELKFKISRQDS